MNLKTFVLPSNWTRFFFIVAALLYAGFSMAGWLIVEKKEDRFGNFQMQSLFIEGQKVRVENQTSTFIFDLLSEEVTIIFPRQLVYWSGSSDTLKQQFISTIEQQTLIMIEQLPEQEREKARKEFDNLLIEMKSSEVDTTLLKRFSIESTDSVATILNLSSHKNLLKLDTMELEQIWITHQIRPYSGISLHKLNTMMRLFSRPTALSAARESDAWVNAINEGLVMRSVLKTPYGPNVMEVIQVRETPVREEFFLPPPTYRQVGTSEVINIMMGEGTVIQSGSTEEDGWKPLLPAISPKKERLLPPGNHPEELP